MDETLFLWVNQALSSPQSTFFFRLVTWFGHGGILALIILPLLYLFDKPTFRRHAFIMVFAVALSGGIANLLKVIIDRPRPPEHFSSFHIPIHVPTDIPTDRSFPSGHSQTAFGVALYLSCLYRKKAPLFIFLAILVGVSRIALGVHFPLDVLAGAVIGSLGSVGAYTIQKRTQREE